MNDRDAYGVAEFCRRHGISRGYLYAQWRRGRVRASCARVIGGSFPEAGADWRRELEAATRAGDNSQRAA